MPPRPYGAPPMGMPMHAGHPGGYGPTPGAMGGMPPQGGAEYKAVCCLSKCHLLFEEPSGIFKSALIGCRTPNGRPSHVCPIATYTLPSHRVQTDAWQLRLHNRSGHILDFETLCSFLCYPGCIDDQVCTQALSLQVAA